jgi:two-component system chemotaxis sensor kinase CheA
MSGTENTSSGANGGAIDMSQFYRVFFDETAEHLAQMENLLLGIDPAAAGDEELNAIFRAAHSIKGGSGTFGFTDMTAVTHELESLLDKARKHEIVLTIEMVDALLAAGDVLKLQLARHRGEPDVAEPPVAEVCARIKGFVTGAAAAPAALPALKPQPQRSLMICFPVTQSEADLEKLLGDLGQYGRIAARSVGNGLCSIQIHTAGSDQTLKDVFAFFVDPAAVKIEDAAAAPVDAGYGFFADPAPAAAAVATDPGYGFFADTPGAGDARPATQPAPPPVQSPGRRASDRAEAERVRTGRRDTDKLAVSAQGDNASIRVGVEKVDQLINQVGELVITQAMLAQSVAKLDPALHQNILTGMSDLERNTRDLQESVMSIRMLPIAFVFNRFPRMARDLAAKLGKQVQLKMEGEATELDKGLIEKISDPLTHLVRNSIDHGIETGDKRMAAGKPEAGTVTLRASHQGGSIVIEVCDDGAGLNRERILAKARERGLPVSDDMSDQEVWRLIFEAGFSTAEVVTDVSGRGVGMDVVKRNITELGGTVEIEAATGVGTRIIVRLPLTLAIIDGMSIAVGGNVYIIPLAAVVESLQAASSEVKSVAGEGRVVEVRKDYLPVIALRDVFPTGDQETATGRSIMLVVESDGVKNALLVDELLGQQQVVVKSLETNYRKVPGIAGATIMGDGKVALILDVPALVKMSRH